MAAYQNAINFLYSLVRLSQYDLETLDRKSAEYSLVRSAHRSDMTGFVTCGSKTGQEWVFGERVGLEHIKFARAPGLSLFSPLDPSFTFVSFTRRYENGIDVFSTAGIYLNRRSERIPGKALKEYNIPRDNVIIMTRYAFL